MVSKSSLSDFFFDFFVLFGEILPVLKGEAGDGPRRRLGVDVVVVVRGARRRLPAAFFLFLLLLLLLLLLALFFGRLFRLLLLVQPGAVKVPVSDVVGVGSQGVDAEAVGLQVLDLLEHVFGVEAVLGELLQNSDPVPQGEVRKVYVVVQQGFAFEGDAVLEVVLLRLFAFREKQPPQIRVVILKIKKKLRRVAAWRKKKWRGEKSAALRSDEALSRVKTSKHFILRETAKQRGNKKNGYVFVDVVGEGF